MVMPEMVSGGSLGEIFPCGRSATSGRGLVRCQNTIVGGLPERSASHRSGRWSVVDTHRT